jgi:hypothetical protein
VGVPNKTIRWNRSAFKQQLSGRLLRIALQHLKYTFNLNDEEVVNGRLENPCWQHLHGMKYFEHTQAYGIIQGPLSCSSIDLKPVL